MSRWRWHYISLVNLYEKVINSFIQCSPLVSARHALSFSTELRNREFMHSLMENVFRSFKLTFFLPGLGRSMDPGSRILWIVAIKEDTHFFKEIEAYMRFKWLRKLDESIYVKRYFCEVVSIFEDVLKTCTEVVHDGIENIYGNWKITRLNANNML